MEKGHLEMILEDINGKFELVLEGQESLRREMHGMRDELSEKIDQNSFFIKVLNNKIDNVDERLNAKIDSVDAKLNAKIDSVDAKLSTKIDNLHRELQEDLSAVATDLKAHRTDTEAHRSYQVRDD